jgi:hypothetical protein
MIDDEIMHAVDIEKQANQILACLNDAFGFGNVDPDQVKRKLKKLHFDPSKNPQIIFYEFDKIIQDLQSAGGTLSNSEHVEFLVDALSGKVAKDAGDVFWFYCRG